MSGGKDPFRKLKAGEPFVPLASQFNMFIEDAQARRTQGQGVDPNPFSLDESTIKITVRNDLDADLDQFSMIRWNGPAIAAAVINGRIPKLQLKTESYSTPSNPIGVTLQKIRKASGGSAAGSGRVACMGVCWARCRGPIAADDALKPDSSYRGIKDESGESNVKALAAVSGSTDAIIPVLIGGGGGTSATGTKVHTLSVRGNVNAGTITWMAMRGLTELATGTWAWNATKEAVRTSLLSLDAGTQTRDGRLPYTAVRIWIPDSTISLSISEFDLTREENGVTPVPELSACYQIFEDDSSE